MEQGGMVLMITHPDYLCHPKLVRRLRRFPQIKKHEKLYDGWLGDEDRSQKTEVSRLRKATPCQGGQRTEVPPAGATGPR